MGCDPDNQETTTCECGEPMSGMMKTCVKRGRWFPLFPIVVGIILFCIGYFCSAEVIRVLWLILSSLVTLMGVAGLIMVNAMLRNRSDL